MAAFDRWKRATVAVSISAELWARRKSKVSTRPDPTRPDTARPTDHVTLVLEDRRIFHGICAAEDYRLLGANRVTDFRAGFRVTGSSYR